MPAQAAASATSTVILSAEPQLLTSDLAAAIEFYQSKLGFALVFSYGAPPFYAQVGKGGARLNLRLIPHLLDAVTVRYSEQDVLSATLVVDDVNPIILEFQSAGVDFAQSPKSEPWGARTFIVRDPDGNLLCFAGEMS
jgi:catechol 2,3-dioxygenase-like lactoylglutathione lyase family enzyme